MSGISHIKKQLTVCESREDALPTPYCSSLSNDPSQLHHELGFVYIDSVTEKPHPRQRVHLNLFIY